MTTKYKVGQRKVLVVDRNIREGQNWFPLYKDTRICEEKDGAHEVYLRSTKEETFTEGDLIAARCVFVDPDGEWSSWKRIGDRRCNLDYSKL